MSRPSSTNGFSFYTSKSPTLSGRNSPGVAGFISSRHRGSFKKNSSSLTRPVTVPPPTSSSPPLPPPPPPPLPPPPQPLKEEKYYDVEDDPRIVSSRPRRFQQIFEGADYDAFDDDDTPSLGDTTIKPDSLKLPLPTGLVADSPAPWMRKADAVEVKEEKRKSGAEKVVNTEMRLAWGGDVGDVPEDDQRGYSTDDGDGGGGRDAEEGFEGGEGYVEEEGEDMWGGPSPTISSRGWSGGGPGVGGGGGALLPYRGQRPEERRVAKREEEADLPLQGYEPSGRDAPASSIPRQMFNEENYRENDQSHNTDYTSLIPDSELSSIASYKDLLSTLSSIRAATHTSIPQTQLPSELSELASSYYPEDRSKPAKFFNKLDDKQHTFAGGFIIGKKRELEGKLADCVAKRRDVVEGMKEEVQKVADVRVKKLRRTEERREVLRGGIGKILRESGLLL